MKLETWTMLGADENHLTPDSVRNPHLQQTLIAGLGYLWPHNVKGGEAGKRGRTFEAPTETSCDPRVASP